MNSGRLFHSFFSYNLSLTTDLDVYRTKLSGFMGCLQISATLLPELSNKEMDFHSRTSFLQKKDNNSYNIIEVKK